MARPVLLVIMDGVGINPREDYNAVVQAKKPFIDQMWEKYPVTRIKTSGEDVGLPEGVMGNSEVGHLNIGAGRVVFQALSKINKTIREGEFSSLPPINNLFESVQGRTLHLMGLVSTGGVHGDVGHIEAILKAAKNAGVTDIAVHAYTDGRDMPPKSGIELIRRLQKTMDDLGVGRFVSVCGRYTAMDRDKRWERIEQAYNVVVNAEGTSSPTAEKAVEESYANDVTDEFIHPIRIGDGAPINDGDSVFFWNFRPDRARQMTRALMDPEFSCFERKRFPKVNFLGMVEYEEAFPQNTAFPPPDFKNILADVICDNGLTQFHSAETEKYAHVTFFFNGGKEKPYTGEDRRLVPSPKVATYDLQPEMSAPEVTKGVLEAIEKGYDFMVVNYANGDMVGHTGVMEAAVKAVEAVDNGLRQIVPKFLEAGGAVIVTADHGNSEQMIWYETGEPHTQHTTYEVTLTVCGAGDVTLKEGRLADISPTVLDLMGLEQPEEMTGVSLIQK